MQSDRQHGLHVAIIMDGNGRWAARPGKARVVGHRAGVAALRRVVEHAPDLGMTCLTLYAFSSDDWIRPADEVNSTFRLMRAYLRIETQRLRQRGVRLQVIGRGDRLPAPLRQEIEKAEFETGGGVCLYSLSGKLPVSPDLPRGMVSQTLTQDSGEVDLLIRTGGEKRLSDFLRESAYAELLFTNRLGPDFDANDLDVALNEFRYPERRFGSLPAATSRSATFEMDGVQ